MNAPLFSVVVPTIGRPSLPKTLASVNRDLAEIVVVADTFEMAPGTHDEIRAIADDFGARRYGVDAGHHDWGSPQLQTGYSMARGQWILNCGDDDVYEPFAFETMFMAIDQLAEPTPLMFRTVLHPGPQRGNRVPVVLWHEPVLEDKKITGQCFVIPNDQDRIGSWSILVDFGFITDTVRLWDGRLAWRSEVISQCY